MRKKSNFYLWVLKKSEIKMKNKVFDMRYETFLGQLRPLCSNYAIELWVCWFMFNWRSLYYMANKFYTRHKRFIFTINTIPNKTKFTQTKLEYGILLPKLFWPTVRKKISSDLEKLLKFEVEGREFAKYLRSLGQFIKKVKDKNTFLKQNAFPTFS